MREPTSCDDARISDTPSFPIPPPLPEHAVLQKDVGTWDADVTFRMGSQEHRSRGVMSGGVFIGMGHFPVVSGRSQIAIADVTGDGKGDVVAATADCAVFLLPGLGNGAVSAAQVLDIGACQPRGVGLGDIDGDGHLDVVVMGAFENQWTLWSDDSADGILLPNALKRPLGHARLVDVTGDGKLDIVTTSLSTSLTGVFPGDGVGGFGAAIFHAAAYQGDPFAIGDLNEDGAADMVVGSSNAGEVRVLLHE